MQQLNASNVTLDTLQQFCATLTTCAKSCKRKHYSFAYSLQLIQSKLGQLTEGQQTLVFEVINNY